MPAFPWPQKRIKRTYHMLRSLYWLMPSALLALIILPFVGWGFSDDNIFIRHYILGGSWPPGISPSNGRFFPLAHQEWRLFPATREAWAYHAISVLQYSIFCWTTIKILELLNLKSIQSFLFVTTLPPIIISFSHIVVPERNQVMFVALWLLSYLHWQKQRSPFFCFLCIVFLNLALYYKEPTFVFIGAFSAAQILRSIAKEQKTSKALAKSTCDIGAIISCMLFVVIYLSVTPPRVLTSDAAYNQYSLSFDKIFPSIKSWTIAEPLIGFLLLGGLCLTLVQWRRERRAPSLSASLWIGGIGYFACLIPAGLVGKYFSALPLFGFAIHFIHVIFAFAKIGVSRSLIGILAIINIFFWAPAILYKHDWTDRNRELVDKIISYKNAGYIGDVFIKTSSAWDGAMLVIYANEFRNADIIFYCNRKNFGMDWIGDICHAANESVAPQFKVDLGHVNSERVAHLSLGSDRVWSYSSIWKEFMPITIRHALARHYNFK